MKSKQCNTCSYHYHDNFCMLNLYYVSDDYTCGRWTDEEIEFDYDRVYRLCKSYIEVCDRYTDGERLKRREANHSKEFKKGSGKHMIKEPTNSMISAKN